MSIKSLFAKLLIGTVLLLSGCLSNLSAEVPKKDSAVKSETATAKDDYYQSKLQTRISKALEARPELFNDEFKESIIKGVVKVGMNIDQAILAGGDYFFAVSADQKVWGKDPNPYQVMDAQLFNPDDSDIKLTFNNNTQFDGEEPVSFRVQILRGKVASITKL